MHIGKLSVAAVLVAGATNASACFFIPSSPSFPSSGGFSCGSLPLAGEPTTVTSLAVVNTVYLPIVYAINAWLVMQNLPLRRERIDKISSLGEPAPTGLAAGSAADRYSFWGSLDDRRFKSLDTAKFSDFQTEANNLILGGDYRVSERFVVGATVAFDRGNTKLSYIGPNSSAHTDGYTIAPYASYQLDKAWSVDGSLGLGRGEVDQSIESVPATVTGSQDVDRRFLAVNLNMVQPYGNWEVAAKASLLASEEKTKDYSLSGTAIAGTTNRLTQARIGVQASYWANGVNPYLGVSYASDVHRPSRVTTGRDGFTFVAGLSVFAKSGLAGGIELMSESGRSNIRNHAVTANLSYRF